MDNINFTMKDKPAYSQTVTVEKAQILLRKAYPDDTVDLFILNILAGKTATFTLNGVTVIATLVVI